MDTTDLEAKRPLAKGAVLYNLIEDRLTLLMTVANAPNVAFISAPSKASDAVFCIRSLRNVDDALPNLTRRGSVFKYFTSWRRYVRHEPGRWRNGHRIRCTGCGKYLSRHK